MQFLTTIFAALSLLVATFVSGFPVQSEDVRWL